MVRLLLDSNARVNEPGRWTGTPLHCACWSGAANVVDILLKHGADVASTNKIWTSFLELGSNLVNDGIDRRKMVRRASELAHQMFDCQPIVIAAHWRQEK
jgi:ankyrin repeat protein